MTTLKKVVKKVKKAVKKLTSCNECDGTGLLERGTRLCSKCNGSGKA